MLNVEFENITIEDIASIFKLQQMVMTYDHNYELVRSKLEQTYGSKDAYVIGTVGEHNQFMSNYTTISKDELINLGLYLPLDKIFSP